MDEKKTAKTTTNKTMGILLFNNLKTQSTADDGVTTYEKTFSAGRLCGTALYGVLGALGGVFVL